MRRSTFNETEGHLFRSRERKDTSNNAFSLKKKKKTKKCVPIYIF